MPKIKITPGALEQLKKAVIVELAKNIEIQRTLGEDDDWPPEFDPNDIPIYHTHLKLLLKMEENKDYELSVDPTKSKVDSFLVFLIPDHVEKNLGRLSRETYDVLKQIYFSTEKKPHNKKFPEWPSR